MKKTMIQWEYAQFITKWDEMLDFLIEQGELGWELCESISLAPAKLGNRIVFLKRRKQQ